MSNIEFSYRPTTWPLAIAFLGVFAIFLAIVKLAHTPVTPLTSSVNVPEEEQWKLSDEGRRDRLAEVKGRDAALAREYGWIDQANGVVRLPVDRAIELTLAEINTDR